ncbi:MAG: cytochrome d ubiquinol oxidase subunit II, partial [Candidatus Hermodarchaeota archaeon]
MSLIQEIWFILLGLIIIIYTILDGFDLGTAFWFFLAKDKKEDRVSDRKILIQAIAPFWDGNEVWLLAAGGILFAAFPDVYATVFSTFYLPLVLVAFGLILRAVSIEFRDEFDSLIWYRLNDISFVLGSMIPAILFGVLIGNLVQGIPLDSDHNFSGSLIDLINPYALLIGLLSLTMIISHGAIYLRLRTTGNLTKKATNWAKMGLISYLIVATIALIISIVFHPHLLRNFEKSPILGSVPILGFIVIIVTILLVMKEKDPIITFITSSFSIFLSILGAGVAMYPTLVFASNDSTRSL